MGANPTKERRSAPAIRRLPPLAGGEAPQRSAGRSMLAALHASLALDVLLEHRERSAAATDDAIRAAPEDGSDATSPLNSRSSQSHRFARFPKIAWRRARIAASIQRRRYFVTRTKGIYAVQCRCRDSRTES